MTKKQKKIRNRLILVAIIYFPLLLLDKLGVYEHVSGIWLPIVLYLIPYVLVSYDVFIHAFKNIGHGRFLDERFLMCIATVAAILYRGMFRRCGSDAVLSGGRAV